CPLVLPRCDHCALAFPTAGALGPSFRLRCRSRARDRGLQIDADRRDRLVDTRRWLDRACRVCPRRSARSEGRDVRGVRRPPREKRLGLRGEAAASNSARSVPTTRLLRVRTDDKVLEYPAFEPTRVPALRTLVHSMAQHQAVLAIPQSTRSCSLTLHYAPHTAPSEAIAFPFVRPDSPKAISTMAQCTIRRAKISTSLDFRADPSKKARILLRRDLRGAR